MVLVYHDIYYLLSSHESIFNETLIIMSYYSEKEYAENYIEFIIELSDLLFIHNIKYSE